MADTIQPDDVVWTASGGPMTIRHAVIFDDRPRTWRERLFSWPWRPWAKWRPPVAVVDFEQPPDE